MSLINRRTVYSEDDVTLDRYGDFTIINVRQTSWDIITHTSGTTWSSGVFRTSDIEEWTVKSEATGDVTKPLPKAETTVGADTFEASLNLAERWIESRMREESLSSIVFQKLNSKKEKGVE